MILHWLFQSTLPRGERPKRRWHGREMPLISIHAPARGATLYSLRSTICSLISIHAPARGATLFTVGADGSFSSFQSTLPRGERRQGNLFCLRLFLFQSTLPRGERHKGKYTLKVPYDISIHAPARGATIINPCDYYNQTISIHAPARGATI